MQVEWASFFFGAASAVAVVFVVVFAVALSALKKQNALGRGTKK